MQEDYSWAEPPRRTAFPVAQAGYPLIAAAAFATLVFALLQLTAPALLGLLTSLAIAGFFRDPDRIVPQRPGQIVSPADGRVIVADVVASCPFLDGPAYKISIFMSVFDVHVNRVPHEGRVAGTRYRPGRFIPADRGEASSRNEHNAVWIETPAGERICFVQVAGLIARRILCTLQKGEAVKRGQRCGMICFGSRLDVYLPRSVRPAVAVGDQVQAGTSVLATFPQEAAHG